MSATITEKVAYWFFRLNGCLTIENFSVHPDVSGTQRTEVDILAARFRHRCELQTSGKPMMDHPAFAGVEERVHIVLAEIKSVTGCCSINGPWTRPQDENLQRVLHAVGAFPEAEVVRVADALYTRRVYATDDTRVSFFALGGRNSSDPSVAPPVVQIIWEEVLQFIHTRMVSYQPQKASHPQWEETGRQLFQTAIDMGSAAFACHWTNEMRPEAGASRGQGR